MRDGDTVRSDERAAEDRFGDVSLRDVPAVTHHLRRIADGQLPYDAHQDLDDSDARLSDLIGADHGDKPTQVRVTESMDAPVSGELPTDRQMQEALRHIEELYQQHGIADDPLRFYRDPNYIHELPHMGFTQLERVIEIDKILRQLDTFPSRDEQVESYTGERTEDRVFRLAVNHMRDLAYGTPKVGKGREPITPERQLASDYAKLMLQDWLGFAADAEPEVEPEPQDQPDVELNDDDAENLFEGVRPMLAEYNFSLHPDFLALLAESNIDAIDWTLLPRERLADGSEDAMLPEHAVHMVPSRERSQNLFDFYNTFRNHNARLIVSEFNENGHTIPYYGVTFSAETPVLTEHGLEQQNVEITLLDRPASKVKTRLSKNPNPSANEPVYKYVVDKGTGEVVEGGGHDAMYLLVSQKPDQWQTTFGPERTKREARQLGAIQIVHSPNGRERWIDMILERVTRQLDKLAEEKI